MRLLVVPALFFTVNAIQVLVKNPFNKRRSERVEVGPITSPEGLLDIAKVQLANVLDKPVDASPSFVLSEDLREMVFGDLSNCATVLSTVFQRGKGMECPVEVDQCSLGIEDSFGKSYSETLGYGQSVTVTAGGTFVVKFETSITASFEQTYTHEWNEGSTMVYTWDFSPGPTGKMASAWEVMIETECDVNGDRFGNQVDMDDWIDISDWKNKPGMSITGVLEPYDRYCLWDYFYIPGFLGIFPPRVVRYSRRPGLQPFDMWAYQRTHQSGYCSTQGPVSFSSIKKETGKTRMPVRDGNDDIGVLAPFFQPMTSSCSIRHPHQKVFH